MTIYVLALVIGVVAGLRTLTAPAAVSWAAYLGWLRLSDTWLVFVGYAWTPWIFTILGLVELVADQLPLTPSRTVPVQFGARLVLGAFSGAVIGAAGGSPVVGSVFAIVGAVIDTLGGRFIRGKLATVFGNDHPAAMIEDVVAIGIPVMTVLALR
jgi:uncharacterized membrane protein